MNWIFMKWFWIEYWIESILSEIQTLNWINLGIGQGYVGLKENWQVCIGDLTKRGPFEKADIYLPQSAFIMCALADFDCVGRAGAEDFECLSTFIKQTSSIKATRFWFAHKTEAFNQ